MTRPLRASLLSLTAAATAWAAGNGRPFYEGDAPPTQKVMSLDEKQLTSILNAQVKDRGVTVKHAVTGQEGVEGLALEVRQGLLMGISSPPGAEVDVLVPVKGGFLAVEVVMDGPQLTWRAVPVKGSLYGPAITREALQAKHGVGAFTEEGATWEPETLAAVDQALGLLTPDERAVLAGMPFVRLKEPTVKLATRGKPMALYRAEGGSARVEVYDEGLEVDRRKFVGSPDAPVPSSVSTLLHEFAHAMAKRAAKGAATDATALRAELEAAAKAFNDGQKQYNEDRATYAKTKDPELKKSLEARAAAAKDEAARVKELQKRWSQAAAGAQQQAGPASGVEAAFAARFPVGQSPTFYGRTAAPEHLAECFRLFRTDRPALERAAPGVAAWFESAAWTDVVKGP